MIDLFCIVLSVIFGSLRLIGLKGLIFKDFAHVIVGGMGFSALTARRWLYLALFGMLCTVELLCAFVLYPIK